MVGYDLRGKDNFSSTRSSKFYSLGIKMVLEAAPEKRGRRRQKTFDYNKRNKALGTVDACILLIFLGTHA